MGRNRVRFYDLGDDLDCSSTEVLLYYLVEPSYVRIEDVIK